MSRQKITKNVKGQDSDGLAFPLVGATNKHRYMLASDSRALRRHLNTEVAGIPLLHTNQSRVIVLEPMSEKTRERVKEVSSRVFLVRNELGLTSTLSSQLEQAKFAATSDVPALPDNVVSAPAPGDTSQPKPPPTTGMKRKHKEANPLSNKKPKKVLEAERAEKARRTREIAERTEAKKKMREAGSAGESGEAPPKESSSSSSSSKKTKGDGQSASPMKEQSGGMVAVDA